MAIEHDPAVEHGHTPTTPLPDDSPPRNTVIAAYTFAAVIILVALRYVFISYFDTSQRAAHAANIAGSYRSEQLAEYRRDQREALAGGAKPIDQAMSDFASQRRSPLITPQPSDDEDPLRGWSVLQVVAVEQEPHAEAEGPAEMPQGEQGAAEQESDEDEAEAEAVEEPSGEAEAEAQAETDEDAEAADDEEAAE